MMKHPTSNFKSISVVCSLLLMFAWIACFPSAVDASETVKVPADRWMEIDLYWFQQDHIQTSVDEFWDRFAPLYKGVQGDRGVILNVGWTVQYIMGWSGNPDQRIILPTGSGQASWVAETGPLNGDWAQMQAEWKQRGAQAVNVERQGYGPWTYGDLKKLATALRETAAKRGISGFKVGSLTYGWTRAYGELAPWAQQHPEACVSILPGIQKGAYKRGPVFDPGASLHADPRSLGGLPGGISEGMKADEALAAQWGNLSKAVGLDALMLRDSFGMPVPYQRGGAFGPLAPSPEVARRWNSNQANLVREVKLANPKALVMMYSNGASAISDWRSNCFDLESVANQGYLDVFVDQTWAGAWNEAGVRIDKNHFWNNPTLGWTYQLTYMLMHSAVLAGTKVKHYPLVETFDAWESWDVLHTVPQRLRWGIWAYSHAGVKMPQGLKLPEGSYISWANQGKRLLSDDDVHFLATNINAAVTDAQQTTEVYGPTLVYSREAMQWQMDHAAPGNDIKEWIDEQAGSVIKWPVPILSVTRMEWVPKVKSDLFIFQTPVHLSVANTNMVVDLIKSGQPVAVFGSTIGGIDPAIQAAIGLTGIHAQDVTDSVHTATASADAGSLASNVSKTFPTRTYVNTNQVSAGAKAIYAVDASPQLVLNTSGKERVAAWDPPIFDNSTRDPLVTTWGGSAAPYALTAGALNFLTSLAGDVHVTKIDQNQTMNFSAWRTADGEVHLMAAELEEGIHDVADHSAHATVVLPNSWKLSELHDLWADHTEQVHRGTLQIDLQHAQSVLFISGH
jgi:hypothetical protein